MRNKMKTNRATAKRMRVRASGSVKRKHAFHSHILTKKTTKNCRNLRQRAEVDATNTRNLNVLLPGK